MMLNIFYCMISYFYYSIKTGYTYVHILNSTVHAVTAMSKMENERKALK